MDSDLNPYDAPASTADPTKNKRRQAVSITFLDFALRSVGSLLSLILSFTGFIGLLFSGESNHDPEYLAVVGLFDSVSAAAIVALCSIATTVTWAVFRSPKVSLFDLLGFVVPIGLWGILIFGQAICSWL